MTAGHALHNGGIVPLAAVPCLPVDAFRREILAGVGAGGRVAALCGLPADDGVRLLAVLAWSDAGVLSVVSSEPVRGSYPALTPACAQVHLFERELAEQWAVRPEGHPWLKPVRYEGARGVSCGVADYFTVAGDAVHEVAVGPVHAGIIEPGHFRFQCHGETVEHLEIMLGYQHRGIERALAGGPDRRTLPYMETLAGDTTVGHATAYCHMVESFARARVPARAQVLRGIALELERMANHIGDLGALAGDIGFLPTQAYCGRIRGDVLNLTAVLCGNRFGRGLLREGGFGADLGPAECTRMRTRLAFALRDAQEAVALLWETPSVLARFEQAGAVGGDAAGQIGLVGVAARASGIGMDVRRDFPAGIYRFAQVPVAVGRNGDVFARAFVRWQEVERSAAFVVEQLGALPDGEIRCTAGALAPAHLGVTLVEGWRGEICHVATTDDRARWRTYKVIDPSFHNWFGLACAMRGQPISDFPLCNKSFNLSYCGHDL